MYYFARIYVAQRAGPGGRTDLHDVDRVGDVLELGVGAAGADVEDEGVEVVAEAERDVEGRKDGHERAQAERDEVDAVRDGLHEERDDLRLGDGEAGGGHRVGGGVCAPPVGALETPFVESVRGRGYQPRKQQCVAVAGSSVPLSTRARAARHAMCT